MLSKREPRALFRGILGAVTAAGLAAALGIASGAPDAKAPAVPAGPPVPAAPEVSDTRTNMQEAFTNEMNAKERYLLFAKQADRDGYPYVAQLFRACARAEQVHADQDVRAIAWTGGEAKALLQRMASGTTAENLQTAVNLEAYEATQLYPAYLARARADHAPEATRSLNYALATEREHVRLLTAALETLDQRLPARTLYVCPGCGRTVEARDFTKCPNCFASAGKFTAI